MISPLLLGEQKPVDLDMGLEQQQSPRKLPSVKGPASKRLSGRPAVTPSPQLNPKRHPLVNDETVDQDETSHKHRSSHHHLEDLIDQVSEWIREERNKRAGKKFKPTFTDGNVESSDKVAVHDHAELSGSRRDSEASFDLNKLEVSPHFIQCLRSLHRMAWSQTHMCLFRAFSSTM